MSDDGVVCLIMEWYVWWIDS